jgi:hypothetical protein
MSKLNQIFKSIVHFELYNTFLKKQNTTVHKVYKVGKLKDHKAESLPAGRQAFSFMDLLTFRSDTFRSDLDIIGEV